MKVTSPGVLLIVAVLAAGGIFLLDLLYLAPRAKDQEWAALREYAGRAAHAARLALYNEQRLLDRDCALLAQDCQVDNHNGSRSIFSLRPGVSIEQLLTRMEIDFAWCSDTSGKLTEVWGNDLDTSGESPWVLERHEIVKALGRIGGSEQVARSGMMKLGNQVVMFARRAIAEVESVGDSSSGQEIWVVRRLDSKARGRIASAVGGPLVFVEAAKLPDGTCAETGGSQALWLEGERELAVAWLVSDVAGKALGYFHADMPVVYIRRQAAAARRTVLIVLSLSVGVTLLVILGTHMLIVGPVIRLLNRLQLVESGKSSAEVLTRDLHGEPLMLARRLESAFDKLSRMSMTDQLTGLANRRHFEEVLKIFYHQAKRYSRPLSLITLDIDFFKAINDTAGHQAGDKLLREIASIVEIICRKADLPARLGGDEFSILLPETTAADAASVAERIRKTVASLEFNAKSMRMNVTVSIGLADLNSGPIDSAQAMVSFADKALYAAKELGRNRIFQAHELDGLARADSGEDNKKVDVLCKKLAGLDTKFKGLFIRAIEEIVDILQLRDPHMANHTRKVQHYSTMIGREMELPERVINRIEVAAMLHDVGMVALPDAVLLAPGPLNEEQLRILRKHPLIGVRIMERMEFLEQEIPAVRYHHERYDGTGYPEGIAGATIPLTARILAVADAIDAMASPRVFRSAKPLADITDEIKAGAGTQFDPAVVDAFMALADRLGDGLTEVPGISENKSLRALAEVDISSGA